MSRNSTSQALADSRGRIWFGYANELIEIARGNVIRYAKADGLSEPIISIAENSNGGVFVATAHSIFEFSSPQTDDMGRGHFSRATQPLTKDSVIRLIAHDFAGGLWISTSKELYRYIPGQPLTRTNLSDLNRGNINALWADRQGNMWVGTENEGLYKMSGNFIVSYTEAEGMPAPNVYTIAQDVQGRIYAGIRDTGFVEIADGNVVRVPGPKNLMLNSEHALLRDRHGDWLATKEDGLYRFPGPKLQFQSGRKFTEADGFDSRARPVVLYEDAAGKVWVAVAEQSVIYEFDPNRKGREAFKRIYFDVAKGGFVAMARDRSGAMWLAFHAGLFRWAEEKLTEIEVGNGLPGYRIRAFFLDSRGWLWLGTRYWGVAVTKDPTVERPQFVTYSTHEGLSSNAVWDITEDNFGRVYLATGRGLDRLDPVTGQIRNFAVADGLASSLISRCFKDRQGNIWIATSAGLSKLDPRAEPVAMQSPPAFFTRVRIAGEDFPLPERGATRLTNIELPSSSNNLMAEFVGVNFQSSGAVKYQYKLEGLDADWSTPSDERVVNLVRLAPGAYRLLARTITADRRVAGEPSMIEFRILPPFYRRWWFVALVVFTIGAAALSLHRIRLRQVVAMEKVRRQVATDLHDDVGSGLAQIAILSEVAKRESAPATAGMLSDVAELARSMRDSMSDIVWAVDPRKDSLSDLVQRMRQATYNLLEANGIRVEFRAPDERELERINFPPDRRRHLLLIFKEAITNIARHAKASTVQVEIALEGGMIRLNVRDNGCGFVTDDRHEGHGLHSLEQRTAELNGQLRIESSPGNGVTMRLAAPVK